MNDYIKSFLQESSDEKTRRPLKSIATDVENQLKLIKAYNNSDTSELCRLSRKLYHTFNDDNKILALGLGIYFFNHKSYKKSVFYLSKVQNYRESTPFYKPYAKYYYIIGRYLIDDINIENIDNNNDDKTLYTYLQNDDEEKASFILFENFERESTTLLDLILDKKASKKANNLRESLKKLISENDKLNLETAASLLSKDKDEVLNLVKTHNSGILIDNTTKILYIKTNSPVIRRNMRLVTQKANELALSHKILYWNGCK